MIIDLYLESQLFKDKFNYIVHIVCACVREREKETDGEWMSTDEKSEREDFKWEKYYV